MTQSPKKQSTLFRGIYDFEDPSGMLIAAKVPNTGSADLFEGTVVIVKPNQKALFVYKGKTTDIFNSGTYELNTDNIPVLTRLANWKLGFQSPLQCELVFFANHTFTGRRWGTPQPCVVEFADFGAVPIRAFGNYNVSLVEPLKFYQHLMGTRGSYSISDIEDFIQGQIVESLPAILKGVQNLQDLSTNQNQISQTLAKHLQSELYQYGLKIDNVQLLSALPSQEILQALEAKTAIKILGSQKEYLLYKAATSLGAKNDSHTNDPMQMMLGLMLSKGLIGADYHEKEKIAVAVQTDDCPACKKPLVANAAFCAHCGKKV